MKTEDSFESIMNSYGIAAESIVATLKCDLSSPGTYGESFVCALEDSICSVGSDGTFLRKKYSEIEDVYTQNFVSSGSIILKCAEGEVVLSYFTLAVSANVECFLRIARKLIAGGEPQPEDFALREKDDFSYINNGRKKLFFRVMSYLPRYKKHLFQMILIIIIATLINLIPPYLTGTVLYDEVLNINGKFAGQIIPLVLVLVMISATTMFLGILQGRIGAEMSGNIIYDIKTEVFSSMQKLGMSFFTSKRTGNLMNRINSDALDIQYFLNDGLPNFIINGLTICAVGLFLFIKNPLLSIAVLIPVPLIALIIKKSSRVFKKLKWRTWRSSSNMNSAINDTFLGVRVVKAFGKEEREIKRFSETSNKLYENRIKEGIASARVFPLLTWIMTLGSLAVWGLGGVEGSAQHLDLGRDRLERARGVCRKFTVLLCARTSLPAPFAHRLVPDLVHSHSAEIMLGSCAAVACPRLALALGIDRRASDRTVVFARVLRVEGVAVAEAEPRLKPALDQVVDYLVEPGEVIDPLLALGAHPAGLESDVLDAELGDRVVGLRGIEDRSVELFKPYPEIDVFYLA